MCYKKVLEVAWHIFTTYCKINVPLFALLQYLMNRAGNCDFTFVAEEKQLRHRVPFNTTEPEKTSWLDGKYIV